MNLNIQGGLIHKKEEELEFLLNKHNINVICISEHHQTQDIHNFKAGNYKTLNFFSRSHFQKGGVCIIGQEHLNYTKLAFNNSTEKNFEMCAIKCNISKSETVTICSIYRSPNGDFEAFVDGLSAMLENTYHANNKIILCGDVNINLLENNKQTQTLINLLSEYNMTPTILEPTRITHNTKTCIDNIFVNFTYIKSKVIETHISDHTYQLLSFKCENPENIVSDCYYRNFSTNNIQAFKNAISIVDWTSLYNEVRSNDVDGCFNIFYSEIQNIFESIFFPIKKNKYRTPKNNKNKWFTPELKNISRMLHEMHKINSRINSPLYKHRYRELKQYYRKQIKNSKKTFNNNRLKNAKNINKESWSIINENSGNKNKKLKISKIISENKNITEQSEICETLNDYFASFANSSDPPQCVDPRIPIHARSLFLFPTTPNEVEKSIAKVCQKKSAGIDEIPGTLCLAIKNIVAPILSQLINLSFSQGVYPSALKISKILPIFKNKGSSCDVENYRPVALQCHFAKIFESCFNDRLTNFLESNLIITKYQNGFRAKHSTGTALDNALQHIYDSLNAKETVLGLFWDMSRAFDTVDHDVLTKKLYNMGIRGPAYSWIKSYLSNRTQRVVIDGVKSSPRVVSRGIPQGSCISPTLFNCYINDMPNNDITNTYFVLYADDTNIIVTGKKRSDLIENSHAGINHVNNWCKDNGIKLNKHKSVSMEIVTKNTTINSNLLIRVEGHSVQCTESTKFLGLNIDQKLTWKIHIEKILPRLSSCSFLIQSIRDTVSMDILKLVYYGLFQSVMAYGIVHWGSASGAERVFVAQKRAVRYMTRARGRGSCVDLFKSLHIMTFPSLYLYSLLLYVKGNLELWNKRSHIHNHNTRNNNMLDIPYSRLSTGQQSPRYVGLKAYNHAMVRHECFEETDNLATFKHKIKTFFINKCYYSVNEFFR